MLRVQYANLFLSRAKIKTVSVFKSNNSFIKIRFHHSSSKQPSVSYKYRFLLFGGSSIVGCYFLYNALFPNIAGFPTEPRALLRKALWCRDKEKDYEQALVYFKQAIDSMKSDKNMTADSWHLVGTILELADLYKTNKMPSEAIQAYNEAHEVLAPKTNFHTGVSIGRSLKLSHKSKNKLVAINLELAHLYNLNNESVKEKHCLDKAMEIILGDSPTFLSDKLHEPQEPISFIKLPVWIKPYEVSSALDQVANYYRAKEEYEIAAHLYRIALHFSSEPEVKSMLLCNLGVTYQKAQHPLWAIDSYNRAINILGFKPEPEELKFPKVYSAVLLNLATAYESLLDTKHASVIYNQLWTLKPLLDEHLSASDWKLVKSNIHLL